MANANGYPVRANPEAVAAQLAENAALDALEAGAWDRGFVGAELPEGTAAVIALADRAFQAKGVEARAKQGADRPIAEVSSLAVHAWLLTHEPLLAAEAEARVAA